MPKASGMRLGNGQPSSALGDFTTPWSVIPISLVASGIGILSAFVALALLRLIGVFTNLFFYLRWSAALSLRLALIWV